MENHNSINEDVAKVKRAFLQSYMRNGIKDFESQRPFLKDLAQLYERRFALDQKWQYALKAFALYNSAGVGLPLHQVGLWNELTWNPISAYLGRKQKQQCLMRTFYDTIAKLKNQLQEIRATLKLRVEHLNTELRADLKNVDECYPKLKRLALESNKLMISFARSVMEKSIAMMKASPPCDFNVVGIGSLGRGEATPYSDVEYLFLIKDSARKPYFERLAVMTYFLIGAMRETKLSAMNIEELEGWYVDGRMKGYQIDGITESSGNIPTYRKSCPNLFIATPSELLEAYKETLYHPSEDSSKGDLTAMLNFTSCIYSHEPELNLLSEFETGRNLIQTTVPIARVEANIEMLAADLKKHQFSLEFDEYLAGFSMTAKSLLYRLPSLISADLAVILNRRSFSSSFDSIESWHGKEFCRCLKTLLACACYARLRCYLYTNCCDDRFELVNTQNDRACRRVSCVDKAQQQLVFAERNVWKLSEVEFFQLCERFLVLQRCMIPMTKCVTVSQVIEQINKTSSETGIVEKVLAQFYSHKWSGTLQAAHQLSTEPNPKIVYAMARSHLQRKEYANAIPLFLALKDEQGAGKPNLDIYRGLAHCYEGVGSLEKAIEIYSKAAEIRGCSQKEQAMLIFEQARVKVKLNEHNVCCLHMLVEALNYLRVYEATSGGSKTKHLLSKHLNCGYDDLLLLLCNPTREIAYCVHVIGQIFIASHNTVELGKLYFSKARSLGLEIVIDKNVDNVTKAIIMNDIGRSCKDRNYLRQARSMLEMSALNDELARQIECDIALSEGVCYARLDETTPMLTGKTLDEPDNKNASETDGEIVDRWLAKSKETIQRAYPDSNHIYYGKLYKIYGEIVRRSKHRDCHESFSKAAAIFEVWLCKLDAAHAYKSDGEVYAEEGNLCKAEECFSKAKSCLEEVFSKYLTKRSDYHDVSTRLDRVREMILIRESGGRGEGGIRYHHREKH